LLNSGEEIKIWGVKDEMGYHELLKMSSEINTVRVTGTTVLFSMFLAKK
jgi:hypothetical protein